jgi:hypothetical protein
MDRPREFLLVDKHQYGFAKPFPCQRPVTVARKTLAILLGMAETCGKEQHSE